MEIFMDFKWKIFARKSDNSSAIQIKNECDIKKNQMKN